ncbi:hypothetical protein EDE15_3388 [Edaphobacter aggregans]|uniref:Uncharacterized protein n=1 Tax=Edaphobacter aggregans TaxID=570835 RepID=A0A3R9R4N3_9BACT|nr:hypothetical protein EDE15_3388 [Edaphobacter aggregans]
MQLLIASILPLTFAAIMFFLGRYFIRHPEVQHRFFTLGMLPQSKFSRAWSRFTGYLFCSVSVGFVILYVII